MSRFVSSLFVSSCCLLLTLPAAWAGEGDPEAQLTFQAHRYTTRDGTQVEAERGTLRVPEKRGDGETRTLELALVRLPSTAAEPGPPIVYLAGGPGSSGIESAKGPRWPFLNALREVGDVLLLDQRGTGSSRPGLVCQDAWSYPFDTPLDPAVALETTRRKARECAQELAQRGTDLSAYNAREIADDVDALRRALGVPRLHLVATSYGTHLALTTIRRHESAIGRAVLMGVVGPDQTFKLPARVHRGLERIGRTYEEEEGTDAGTPLPEAIETVLGRLDESVDLTVFDPLTGNDVDLRIGRFDLQLATLRSLGDRRRIAGLQADYLKMVDGDFRIFGRQLLATRKWWIGRAMPYAVLCTSGVSPERWDRVTEQAEDLPLGRWIDFPFPDICPSLGLEALDPSFRSPLRSPVPVLAISGTLDVRTPLENAQEVLAGLPNGRHLVVEGAGHGDDLLVASPEIAHRAVRFLRGESVAADRIVAVPLWERVLPPPPTDPIPVTETLHGVEITDPYRWLEKDDTPETRWWVEVQNRYTDALLEVLPGRERLRRQLRKLLELDVAGRPWVRGDRFIYAHRRPGEDRASIVLRSGENGTGEVLLDPRTLSREEGGFEDGLQVRVLDVSRDGSLLAYSVQEGGEDEVEVRLFDVDRRRTLADRLPKARYFGVSILPDNRGLYYGRELAPGRGAHLFFHPLGGDSAEDRDVFGAGYDSGTIVWGNVSDDGRYLVHHALSGSKQRVDVYLEDLAEGGGRREVVTGVDATFYGGVLGGRLVLHTNWRAPRGRVMVADLDQPGREGWREIIPERKDVVIEQVFGAGGRLFVEYLEDVHSRLVMFDLKGRELGEVPFPALGSLDGIRGRWDQKDVYLSFSSFHLPATVYRFDVAAEKLEVWHRAGASIDPERFEIRQVWFRSADGTRVPMFLVHPRDLELDGSNPTLLTGYGGFGTSLTPSFNAEIAAWLERGGVYAVANVRGGGEFGDTWHEAAVREKKQTSFDDFIAAAEWLIAQRYTRPDKLAISGHSNGGLLVAAAMTQRPELFRAVVCSHPLLDMLRYNKFLAARFWLPEYGSAERADAFEYLYAYSPYHRIEADVEYPAVFFLTGAGDTRVAPLHARKMTARMQAQMTRRRPVLLRHHQRVGHSGEDISLSLRSDELVDTLSFLWWQLGEL